MNKLHRKVKSEHLHLGARYSDARPCEVCGKKTYYARAHQKTGKLHYFCKDHIYGW